MSTVLTEPAEPAEATTSPTVPRQPKVLRTIGLVIGLVALGFVTLASLRFGSAEMSTRAVLDAFIAFDITQQDHLIVRTLRLPRTLIGIGVGASLAIAGAIMQAVTRNALASPTILGVNAGASFAIVVAIFLGGVASPAFFVWFAFPGAFLAAVVVYSIGSGGRSGATPVKLALAGAVVTVLLESWVLVILVLNQRALDEVRFWLAGSIAGRDLAIFLQIAPFLVVGLAAGLLAARQFNILSLGDDVARGLGQATGRIRALAAVIVVLLAGGSVAAAGPILFVGLAVPHMVRSVIGQDYRWILAYCAVAGPLLVLLADILGRVVARPSEIPVGIVTAVLGAPFLIHLARRQTVSV